MKSAKSSLGCWTRIGIARIIVVAIAVLGAAQAGFGQLCDDQHTLTSYNALGLDEFGQAVAMSGDTVVVGAPYENHFDGSVYVFVLTGPPGGEVWTEQAKLDASDAATWDLFGASVAISGDTAVVGAPTDDNTGGADAGSAYVFTRSGPPGSEVWTQQAKLIASDGVGLDAFGISVALSGDTAVVGADREDTGGFDAGAAYVFIRSGPPGSEVWTQQAKLTASDAAAQDYFGYSAALSGDTAVLGAYRDDHAGGFDAGSAYVFVRSGSPGSEVWTEQAKLTASDAAAEDHLGDSVALSGDTAVVGAPLGDNAGGFNAGSAYVFVRSGSPGSEAWTQQAKLTASDAATHDVFGVSVAISGDTAVIGKYADGDHGSIYVFTRSGPPGSEVWTEQATLTDPDAVDYDFFGLSVAVSGDTALVGAPKDDYAGLFQAGAAYVFTRTATIWNQQAKLVAFNQAAGDEFGVSVAISGDIAVVGARLDDNASGIDAGAAYVYARYVAGINVIWTQEAKLISDGDFESAGNQTGISVAISGDTALVGSWLWPNQTTGAAYVFVRSGPPGSEVWTQQAALYNPQFGNFQWYGHAVALEGDTALIGSLGVPGGAGGAVYFAARTGPPGGEFWTQQGVSPSDGVSGDQFGNSVAMSPSEDTAVVGAWYEDNAGGVDAGSAYIFVRSGNSWVEYAKLTASDGAADDHFGVKVAISGDTAVVGAYLDDHAGGVDAGSAYVFTRSGPPGSEVWTEQAKLSASDAAAEDAFGISLALSGDKVVVGAYADDHGGGVDAGSAYVFTRAGAVWTEQFKLTSPDPAADDWFGVAVALSGNTSVIGARQDDNAGGVNAGSAYVFDLSCGFEAGDCDLDGQVNLADYAGLPACMSGPTSPSAAGCECHDLDGDADVDLSDFAAFADAFTG